jgi:HrpA-like RNA helicase
MVRGVRHIIDTGYYQRPLYHSLTGEQSLEEVLISQSSARQRGGRAAREGPGTVWRIYTENDYQGMEPHSRAGASVDDLFTVHWRLRKQEVSTISDLTAHIIDTPDFDIVCGALKKLSQLGLREEAGTDQLTPLGQKVLAMPLLISAEERLSLAYAKENQCGTLVAMLIVAMQAYGYRDNITTRELDRSLGFVGDFRVLIEQLNGFVRRGMALRIASSYVRRRIQATISAQREYTHQSEASFSNRYAGELGLPLSYHRCRKSAIKCTKSTRQCGEHFNTDCITGRARTRTIAISTATQIRKLCCQRNHWRKE